MDKPPGTGPSLRKILLYGGVPILGISVVLGFLIFLRSPGEMGGTTSLDNSTDSAESAPATSDGPPPSTPPTTSTPTPDPTTAAPTTGPPASAAAAAGSIGAPDPVEAGRLWLTHYRSASWKDETPAAWMDRLAPYITPELLAEYEAQTDPDSTNGGWSGFVSDKCTSTVEGADGVVPPEAPSTDTEVYVSVTGTVQTTCENGPAPKESDVVTAMLAVTEVESGRWLVSARVQL